MPKRSSNVVSVFLRGRAPLNTSLKLTSEKTYVGISRYGDPDNVFVYADQAEFENASHLLDEDNNMSDVGHVT